MDRALVDSIRSEQETQGQQTVCEQLVEALEGLLGSDIHSNPDCPNAKPYRSGILSGPCSNCRARNALDRHRAEPEEQADA